MRFGPSDQLHRMEEVAACAVDWFFLNHGKSFSPATVGVWREILYDAFLAALFSYTELAPQSALTVEPSAN